MIGVYIRVSSSSQKHDSQRAEIQRWLDGQGIDEDIVEWFEDVETGATLTRPAFKQLQEAVFNGEVRIVVVWKLDRLSRSMKDGINILADWCDKGIRVVSVTQQLDLTGTVGRMIAVVLFGVAEIEREHVRDRQAAGIALAKKRGVYTGRKAGTTKGKPSRAKQLKGHGLTNLEIAKTMGISLRTVSNYLKAA